MKTMLLLEDGKIFWGKSFGGKTEIIGKVCFNTAVVGYQEMLTDPTNAGKLLVLTYPLVGNYGVADKFNESNRVWPEALVIKEMSRIYSNWQAEQSLEHFAKQNKLTIVSDIDTRTLAVHIRQKGEMLGIISNDPGSSVKELSAKLEESRKKPKATVLPEVSVKKITRSGPASKGKKIAVLDLGMTRSLYQQLEAAKFQVTALPYNTKAAQVLKLKPQGLIISGGPEEDPALDLVADNLKEIIGKIPILAISTGFQVLSRALGVKLVPLKLGHRGANYPIQYPGSAKGQITVQNHGLTVDASSLSALKQIKITGFNLNDRSVEEAQSRSLKFLGVQYELSSPGLGEINPVVHKFAKMLERSK